MAKERPSESEILGFLQSTTVDHHRRICLLNFPSEAVSFFGPWPEIGSVLLSRLQIDLWSQEIPQSLLLPINRSTTISRIFLALRMKPNQPAQRLLGDWSEPVDAAIN